MWVYNLSLLFVLFIYFFNIKIFLIPISLSKLIVVFIFIYEILKKLKNKRKVSKISLLLLWLFLILIIYSLLVPLILQTNDFFIFKTNISLLIECFLGSYLVARFYSTKLKLDSFEVISHLTFFQSIIVILLYIFPELRNYLFNNIIEMKMNFNLNSQWFNRGVGIGAAGAILSIVQFIGCICSIFKIEEKKYQIFFIFQIISIILAGRTGLILLFLGILYLTALSIINKKIKRKIKKIYKLIVILFLLGIIFYFLFLRDNNSINRLLEHSFEMLINLKNKGEISTKSTISLKKMIIFPEDITTLLYGDGKWFQNIGSNLNYMQTDSGYIRNIYFGGLILCMIYYIFWIIIIFKTFIMINKSEKKIYFLMILSLFLAEIKEPTFMQFTINKIIIYIFWCFLIKKNEIIVGEKN
ncbi:MAG: hypothetical protein ACRC5S_07600 [Cetobacterium sp.]